MAEQPEVRRVREAERWSALRALDELLDGPMLWLALIWLVLLGLELSYGLHPVLSGLSQVIWALFGLQFAIEFVLAPRKLTYLRRNWLTAVALVLPALRLVRIASLVPLARLAVVGRAARLVNVVESL
ncbi:MAG: hypothetical protein HUU35_02775, partial [Armatimonadetes bacterium]|nr:hypothetical protein [Armatimonadota bacterium]